MSAQYEIHPRIGVARLGNSPDDFYLGPETIGGLPIACDADGNAIEHHGEPVLVDGRTDGDSRLQALRRYKDNVGRIKRQAARFRVFKDGNEVTLADDAIEKIVWTVQIANKKPIWYTFSELQGDLEFGEANSYANQHIPVNNPDTKGSARKALMIDPGPRQIDQPGDVIEFSRYNVPDGYTATFPSPDEGGQEIVSLGDLRMDREGRLIALGGFGNVTGSGDITSFRGAAGFWDDISDGYVLATICLKDGTTIDTEPAWLLVGSPKFAPQLVNITTLWDTMFDTAVRGLGADPEIYDPERYGDMADQFPSHQGYTPLAGYNPDYVVDFRTQIVPILERMQSYRWVADIPYLADFVQPHFPLADPRPQNREHRERYFEFFRVPVLPADYDEWIDKVENGPNQLFSKEGLPLLPLNSGDNSVTNSGPIYKFETLSATQYFFMNQWAAGKFQGSEPSEQPLAERLDEAGVGNCVGAPFSPGIETTWISRNAPIYRSLANLKLAHYQYGDRTANQELVHYYFENGLSTTADEAEGQGCEPGDLTKRMAIPWQSDFQECTVQTPNITDPKVNQFADGTGIEVPPTYYVYWWPPQSPMHVVTGSLDPGDQVLDATLSKIAGQPVIPAGQRVPYQRGILTIQDMLANWSRLGFVVDQGTDGYPYFVETERGNGALVQYLLNFKASQAAANKT